MHTPGRFFRSNINPDFSDSPLERFFGTGSEENIFDKRFSVQKWYTTVTIRDVLTEPSYTCHFNITRSRKVGLTAIVNSFPTAKQE